MIPPAKRGGGKRSVDIREVVNALMSVLSGGCQRRAIPKGLPPRSTVYGYFTCGPRTGRSIAFTPRFMAAHRERVGLVKQLGYVFGGFAKRATLVGGFTLGLLLIGLFYGAALFDGPGLWANLPALWSGASFPGFAIAIAGSIAIVGFSLGKAGQYALFLFWGAFDYGRDWDRVVLFAGGMIALFGGLYTWLGPEHIGYLQYDPSGTAQEPIWFYPWFVALMGFASLGVTGIAALLTAAGAIVTM